MSLKSIYDSISYKIRRKIERKLRRFYRKRDRRIEKRAREAFYNSAIDNLFSDLTVKQGVFKGLKYPGRETVCSVYIPKLIGSYELEIQPAIASLLKEEIVNVVNVGCAEGYYAVGLAMKMPNATVYAYDIDIEARQLCAKMAAVNGVQDRVVIKTECNPEELKSLPLDQKALIVCDCEGYEKELFSEEVVPHLKNCHLLIEIHDVIDINISSELHERFEATHDIQVFESVDDIKKARLYQYDELKAYDLAEKKLLLAEHRGALMEWFYMKPRSK